MLHRTAKYVTDGFSAKRVGSRHPSPDTQRQSPPVAASAQARHIIVWTELASEVSPTDDHREREQDAADEPSVRALTRGQRPAGGGGGGGEVGVGGVAESSEFASGVDAA